MSLYFLYAHDRCDRCGALTAVRTLSYFTDETLCLACLGQEVELKSRLRNAGIELELLEGCGTVPRFAGVPEARPTERRPARVRRPAQPRPVTLTRLARRPTVRRITEEDLRAAVRRLRARSALARIAPGSHSAGRDLPPAN